MIKTSGYVPPIQALSFEDLPDSILELMMKMSGRVFDARLDHDLTGDSNWAQALTLFTRGLIDTNGSITKSLQVLWCTFSASIYDIVAEVGRVGNLTQAEIDRITGNEDELDDYVESCVSGASHAMLLQMESQREVIEMLEKFFLDESNFPEGISGKRLLSGAHAMLDQRNAVFSMIRRQGFNPDDFSIGTHTDKDGDSHLILGSDNQEAGKALADALGLDIEIVTGKNPSLSGLDIPDEVWDGAPEA